MAAVVEGAAPVAAPRRVAAVVRRVMPLDGTGGRLVAPRLRRPVGYVVAGGVAAAVVALPSVVLCVEGWLR